MPRRAAVAVGVSLFLCLAIGRMPSASHAKVELPPTPPLELPPSAPSLAALMADDWPDRRAADAASDELRGDVQAWFEDNATKRIHVMLDKPIYQPGDAVWVRTWSGYTADFAGKSGSISYSLIDPKGAVVKKKRVRRSAGSASNDLSLPSAGPGGLWTVRAELPTGEREERTIVVRTFETPKLHKDLDFLRRAYGPGDTVNATVEAKRKNGDAVEGELEAVVSLGGQVIHTASFPFQDGAAAVTFDLPESLTTSDGVLTAIVRDGGLTESIGRPIPIVLADLAMTFYPEGGDLVEGLTSRVYFDALDLDGSPADVSGDVVDDRGEVVADFRSVHEGLGRFELTPEAGQVYTARIHEPAGVARTWVLPPATPSGCVLTTWDDSFRILVRCTEDRATTVVATLREQVLDVMPVAVKADAPEVVTLREDGRVGVARITLLAEDRTPIAERLVYRNRAGGLDVKVAPDRDSYGPRDEVVLDVTTRTADGEPVSADLSIAVVDDNVLAFADDEDAPTIVTHLTLGTELPEPVEKPQTFFDTDEPSEALELLLGTRGWRRFAWRSVEDGTLASVTGELRGPWNDDAMRAHFAVSSPDADGLTPRQRAREIPPATVAASGLFGSGGLGLRGSGLGGGGMAEGIGGLGTKGMGSGRSGYGSGGGMFGRKAAGTIATVGGDPMVMGALDKSIIDREIKRHMNGIRYCYQRELQKNPKLAGKVVQRFAIAKDGSVAAAYTKASSLANKTAESCIEGRIKRIRFPAPSGGGLVVVNYPFLFSSGEHAEFNEVVKYEIPEAFPKGDIDVDAPARGAARWNNLLNGLRDDDKGAPKRAVAQRAVANRAVANHARYAPQRLFPAPRYRNADGMANFIAARDDHRETLAWAPRLRTNAKGKAEFRFHLSDDIATFRVITEGLGGGSPGRHETTLVSTLPFSIDPKLPVEVAAGDEVLLPITVANERDEPVDVQLEAELGNVLEGEVIPTLRVPAKGRHTVHLPLTARAGAGKVALSGSAAGLTHEVSRTLSVVPAGFPVNWSASGESDSQVSWQVEVSDAVPDSLVADVSVYPGPLSTLMAGIDGMMREPHGCFEQASSANYPNVMVLRYLREHGAADLAAQRRARGLLDRGYAKLTSYESADGGYEWFGRNPGHEALTAYGLVQFADMAEVWEGVDPTMVDRTVDWILERRDGKGGYTLSKVALDGFGRASPEVTAAYVTWALTELDRTGIEVELAAQTKSARSTSDPYLLALATHTLANVGSGSEAAGRLVSMQGVDGAWRGVGHSITRSSGGPLHVETTSLAVMALIEAGGHDEAVRRAVSWLMTQRGGFGDFGPTQATVLALDALTAYARTTRRLTKPARLVVRVDGEEVGSRDLDPGHRGRVQFDLAPYLRTGTNAIGLDIEAERPLQYSARVNYRTLLPPSGDDAPLAFSTELASTDLRVGDSVRLTATIANVTEDAVASPIARIGLPGGLAFQDWQLKELKESGVLATFETGPREVVAYFDAFRAGEAKTLNLDLIAEIPGRYTAPASSAWAYYSDADVRWVAGPTVDIRRN